MEYPGSPEDLKAQLEALIDRYPAASQAAKDAVRAMHVEYKRLTEASQPCRLTRRASCHLSTSCSYSAENILEASQDMRALDMPNFNTRASTGDTCTDRRSRDMLENAVSKGIADPNNSNSQTAKEAEPQPAGELQSSPGSFGLAEGGGPTGGCRAYFGRLQRRCMQEAAGQNGGREAALQLLASALPGKGLNELRDLDRRRSRDNRRRHMQASSSADAGRRAAHLLARAEARLATSAEAAERRAQAAAEAALRKVAREKQRAELAVMAQRRAAAAAEANLARSAAEQAAAAAAEKRQQAEQRARERDAVALAQHKAAAAAREESLLRSHAVAAAAAAWQSEQRAAADAARVAHRERLRAEKAAARDAAAAADAAAAHRRELRMLELAAQVKVAVAADPARAVAPTAASAAPAAPVTRAFQPVHGYTTADILKDKRFKVLEALRQCSLDRSPHAGNALTGMS